METPTGKSYLNLSNTVFCFLLLINQIYSGGCMINGVLLLLSLFLLQIYVSIVFVMKLYNEGYVLLVIKNDIQCMTL